MRGAAGGPQGAAAGAATAEASAAPELMGAGGVSAPACEPSCTCCRSLTVRLTVSVSCAQVEAPPLAIIVPLLVRGLRERVTAIKRKACVIIDNMAKLVEFPWDAAPFLPKLIPELEKVRRLGETGGWEKARLGELVVAAGSRPAMAPRGAADAPRSHVVDPWPERALKHSVRIAPCAHAQVKEEVADPECRQVASRAYATLMRVGGEGKAPEAQRLPADK